MSEYILKNYMEVLVLHQLDEFLAQHPNICGCERCRFDIVALTLNRLPPKYVLSEKGEVFIRVAATTIQNRSDVLAALTQAAIKVSANPNHNHSDE